MSLIGRLIDKLLTKGSITLLTPGKAPRDLWPRRRQASHGPPHRPQGRVRHFEESRLGRRGSLYGRAADRSRTGPSSTCSRWWSESNRWEDAAKAQGAGRGLKRLLRKLRRNDPSALAAQRRAPLRPQRRALRTLPRRRQAVQLRLLHRSRQQPRAGAGRQEGAHRREARPEARTARARHRLRLGRDGALSAPGRRSRRARDHAYRSTNSRSRVSAPPPRACRIA